MIPRVFDYFDPGSFGEAVDLLGKYGEDAKVMAGGQSLLPMMKLRVVSPAVIVDLCRIPDLAYIREDNGCLRIGALTTHYMLHTSDLIQTKLPILADAARVVGDPLVRNLGTMGGSAAHAAHNADYPAVLVALEAEMCMAGPKGERKVGARDFFQDVFTTALGADEILTEVRIPVEEPVETGAYLKLSRRGTDFAIVGVAAVLRRQEKQCKGGRIVLSGVGPVPVRADEAARLLDGAQLDPDLLQTVGETAASHLDPPSDVQADAQYRLEAAKVFVRRTLEMAWNRAS